MKVWITNYMGCNGETIYCEELGAYRNENDFCNYAEKNNENDRL